ncbi:MAG: hypothetical protein U0075_10335 [Thermomicrobiales bacterium]
MANHEPDLPQDHIWVGSSEWHPPTQATFLNGRRDATYWLLVDQLMHLGWYRLGQRPGNGREWGFRRGYTLPDSSGDSAPPARQERWIEAFYEQTAMRRLLRDVQAPLRTSKSIEPKSTSATER